MQAQHRTHGSDSRPSHALSARATARDARGAQPAAGLPAPSPTRPVGWDADPRLAGPAPSPCDRRCPAGQTPSALLNEITAVNASTTVAAPLPAQSTSPPSRHPLGARGSVSPLPGRGDISPVRAFRVGTASRSPLQQPPRSPLRANVADSPAPFRSTCAAQPSHDHAHPRMRSRPHSSHPITSSPLTTAHHRRTDRHGPPSQRQPKVGSTEPLLSPLRASPRHRRTRVVFITYVVLAPATQPGLPAQDASCRSPRPATTWRHPARPRRRPVRVRGPRRRDHQLVAFRRSDPSSPMGRAVRSLHGLSCCSSIRSSPGPVDQVLVHVRLQQHLPHVHHHHPSHRRRRASSVRSGRNRSHHDLLSLSTPPLAAARAPPVPGALPSIFTRSRITATFSIVGTIVGDFFFVGRAGISHLHRRLHAAAPFHRSGRDHLLVTSRAGHSSGSFGSCSRSPSARRADRPDRGVRLLRRLVRPTPPADHDPDPRPLEGQPGHDHRTQASAALPRSPHFGGATLDRGRRFRSRHRLDAADDVGRRTVPRRPEPASSHATPPHSPTSVRDHHLSDELVAQVRPRPSPVCIIGPDGETIMERHVHRAAQEHQSDLEIPASGPALATRTVTSYQDDILLGLIRTDGSPTGRLRRRRCSPRTTWPRSACGQSPTTTSRACKR